MNILAISGILPVSDIIPQNDFVFQIYSGIMEKNPSDRIVIIRPVKYDLNPVSILKGRATLTRMKRKRRWELRGFHVEIFPFFSTWRLKNLHAFITRTIYHVNRKRIRALFEEYDFDVIHAQYVYPDGLLAQMLGKRYGIPYFVTTHNEAGFFKQPLSRRIALSIFKESAGVRPINYTNLRVFKKLGAGNIELSPLGFHKGFIRDQRNPGNGTVRILTVAELIPLKNIDKVVLALGALSDKYDFTYTIIGKGPEKNRLELLVGTLGLKRQIDFIESVPHEQIADVMYEHDVFIMPSFFETFGRVYFEAMAMGIPVICAKNSGIFGIFRENEEGISVDHTSVLEIQMALELLITKEEVRLSMGRKGKALVEEYTWDRVVENLREAYQQAIG